MYFSNNETYDSEDEELSISGDESGASPKKKRKLTIDKTFKNKVLDVLTKGADAAAGGFVKSGKIENAPMVVISLKNGNKRIKCPLYENEAAGIIESFEQSPFGRGSETLVDTSVRNSWQLSPEGFEILNPNWNTFIETVLTPRIITEMVIQTDFTASLYKLLLYKAGSFFKPHRDSEKAEGMFATLVIQLPSKYVGGQLVVKHDGKSETVDFSSSGADYKEFSTFFSAFYCDCEHEILPVTEGYRLCLIYNLISKKSDCIPVAPASQHVLETDLVALMENRNTPWKLVYALKHKYSESNLSYDSLKTTDKAVAKLLKAVAKTLDLNIYLAIFNKESSGNCEGEDEAGYYGCSSADFDSNDEDISVSVSYDLKQLKSVIGPAIAFELEVDIDEDVIPEDTFDNIEPYNKTCLPTGNDGIDINKYYRSAAIAFWPAEFILQVFLSGGAGDANVDALFLEEIEKNRIKGKIDKSCKHLLGWATAVAQSTTLQKNNIPRIKAIIEFENLELVQKLFHRSVTLNKETIPLILNQCEKYGWKHFSDAIAEMLNTESIPDAATKLNLLVEELAKDKKEVCHSLLKGILAKNESTSASQQKSYFRYQPTTKKTPKENQEFLFSVGVVAEKVEFTKSELFEIVKKEPFSEFVPVLLRLLSPRSNVTNNYWMEVTTHFLVEMEKETAKPIAANSWKREISQGTCTCADCVSLDNFLRADKQSESFKIEEKRRKHIQARVKTMQNISQDTEQDKGKIGVLILKKTQKSGYDETQKRNVSLELIKKLRSAMPK